LQYSYSKLILDGDVSIYKGPIDFSNVFFKPLNVIIDLLLLAFAKHKMIIFPLKVPIYKIIISRKNIAITARKE